MPSYMQVLQTFANQIPALYTFLMYVSYLIGFIAGIQGLYDITQYRKRRLAGESGFNFIYPLTFGALMIDVGGSASVMSNSIFGDSTGLMTPDAYTTLSQTDQTAAILTLVFACITLIGYYGLVKGLYIFKEQGSPGASREPRLKAAWVHLIGGTLAANGHLFCIVIESSFGMPDFLAAYLPA